MAQYTVGATQTAPNTIQSEKQLVQPHRNGRRVLTADGFANNLLVFLLSPNGLSGPDIFTR